MARMTAAGANALAARWAAIQDEGGSPASDRTSPSHEVVWAVEEIKKRNMLLETAIDIGCGRGRNSLYLAGQDIDVTAMDFTPHAIEALEAEVSHKKLQGKIRPIIHDAIEPWPVAESSADFIIDAFCFKHIAGKEARQSYRIQLLRALRTRGHYLISFSSIGDGYYGQYVTEKTDEQGGQEHVAIDPVNGIQSTLFDPERVKTYFGPELVPLAELHNDKPSVMHGKEYKRRHCALLFQRNRHMMS